MLCFVQQKEWDIPKRNSAINVVWKNSNGLMRTIKNTRVCSILDRYTKSENNEEILYKVTMKTTGGNRIEVSDIPRRAIKFVDVKYSADQHLSNAFRHEISIPDDIFPTTWRDQKSDHNPNPNPN